MELAVEFSAPILGAASADQEIEPSVPISGAEAIVNRLNR